MGSSCRDGVTSRTCEEPRFQTSHRSDSVGGQATTSIASPGGNADLCDKKDLRGEKTIQSLVILSLASQRVSVKVNDLDY